MSADEQPTESIVQPEEDQTTEPVKKQVNRDMQDKKRRIQKEENKKAKSEISELKKKNKQQAKEQKLSEFREQVRAKHLDKIKKLGEKRTKAITKQLKPVFHSFQGIQKHIQNIRRVQKNNDMHSLIKNSVDIIRQNINVSDSEMKAILDLQ